MLELMVVFVCVGEGEKGREARMERTGEQGFLWCILVRRYSVAGSNFQT